MSYLGATPKAPLKEPSSGLRWGEVSWGHHGERLRDVRHLQSGGGARVPQSHSESKLAKVRPRAMAVDSGQDPGSLAEQQPGG